MTSKYGLAILKKVLEQILIPVSFYITISYQIRIFCTLILPTYKE